MRRMFLLWNNLELQKYAFQASIILYIGIILSAIAYIIFTLYK